MLTSLATLAALAGAVQAQQQNSAAPAAPTADPNQPRLDAHLLRWEQEMSRVQTLVAVLNRREKDKTFETEQKFSGFAQYMKAGAAGNALNLAMLEMRVEGKNEVAEKFICTGTYLYQFLPGQREIRAYELPKPRPGQVADDNFLSFLFGMKAEEAKRRYDLKLLNEDQYYIYVGVRPRFPKDRADFQQARIVLNRDSYLPRQLWFEQPNGSEVFWDLPKIQAGVRLNRADFDAPKLPQGWKLTQVPQNGDLQPRVIRSGQ
jgi:TIGR03009 family protein